MAAMGVRNRMKNRHPLYGQHFQLNSIKRGTHTNQIVRCMTSTMATLVKCVHHVTNIRHSFLSPEKLTTCIANYLKAFAIIAITNDTTMSSLAV